MRFRYWDNKLNEIISNLATHEKGLEKLAASLGLNPDIVIIEYNRKASIFEKWYGDNTIGIVEQNSGEFRVAINGNLIQKYIANSDVVLSYSIEDMNSNMAKTYAMIAAVVMSEYTVEGSSKYKKIAEGLPEEIKILAFMYIAARLRMQIPEVRKMLYSISDPYLYQSYEILSDLDWRDLFNIVAYYTEYYSAEPKTFWGAMVKREQGKALQAPNQMDKMIATLERIYDEYIKQV